MADSEASGARTGGCLCGAVRYTATPHGAKYAACHCSTCRKWTAGPFFAIHCGGDVTFADTAQLGVYRSSEWAERGFCRTCGGTLFYRLVNTPHYEMAVETFDDPSGLIFADEIFIDEKPDRYDFATPTRKRTGAEVFAEFASQQGGEG